MTQKYRLAFCVQGFDESDPSSSLSNGALKRFSLALLVAASPQGNARIDLALSTSFCRFPVLFSV